MSDDTLHEALGRRFGKRTALILQQGREAQRKAYEERHPKDASAHPSKTEPTPAPAPAKPKKKKK